MRSLKFAVGAAAIGAAMLAPSGAAADFTSELELTTAMELTSGVLGASYSGDNAGASVETATVAGFPTAGSSYLVLSTGRASDFTSPDTEEDRTTNLGGPAGAAGFDQSQLAIRLDPPAGAECFAFDFRFFSEEYPEFVGDRFNDAFTAEIVESDITLGNDGIITPWNFAFDGDGNAITINTVAGFSDDDVTTFDGSTPLLTAVTPVELNDDDEVLITLTIQDVGDPFYDSAVAIDNARWLFEGGCDRGAAEADRDGDRLPDSWEENGLDVDSDGVVDLDLPAMGADPDRKDIFLEIDWMFEEQTCIWFICWGGEDFAPRQAAIDTVIAAFADAPVDNPDGSTGITLHVDAGPGSVMDSITGATWGALSQGNAVDHVDDLGASIGNDYQWAAFDVIKDANFDDVRRDVFHYAVYADRYGGSSSSGISRGILGADLIVSQGAFNGGSGFTLAQEQGTLMHEFGHNLGLRHGGDENANRKPNYLSVMSYAFQFTGLRANGQDLGPDYSAEVLDPLDENDLDETVGLGPDALVGGFGTRWVCGQSPQLVEAASGPVDWDCDGNAGETSVALDINPANVNGVWVSTGRTVLTGHDDWASIRFDGGAIGQLGQSEPPPDVTPDDELTLELAEALDVLTGDFDALLAAPSTQLLLPDTGARSIGVTLSNVGKLGDRYVISLTDDGLGVTPVGDVDLDAGATSTVPLVVETDALAPGTYALVVDVTSAGTGEVIATATIEVEVPDLSDPAVQDALNDALDDLDDVPPGEGPDDLEQIVDMLTAATAPSGPDGAEIECGSPGVLIGFGAPRLYDRDRHRVSDLTAVDVAPGEYTVTLVSLDGFHPSAATQPHERWVLELLDSSGDVLFTSPAIGDLADDATQRHETVATAVLPAGVTHARARHAGDGDGLNSVVPKCAVLQPTGVEPSLAPIEDTEVHVFVSSRREVPRVVSPATGVATFRILDDGTRIEYRMRFRHLENVVGVHLHLGPPSENGPIVAPLAGDPAGPGFVPFPLAPGGGPFRELTGSLSADSLVGPLEGQPLRALIVEMTTGTIYLNVHTDDGIGQPGTGPGDVLSGEIRGNLRLR